MKKLPKAPAPAKSTTPSPFDRLLATLAALYEEEIHRLVAELRPRIMAGEFSQSPGGEPGWIGLARHLEGTSPWLTTVRRRLVSMAASRWVDREEKALTNPTDGEVLSGGVFCDPADGSGAAECMAHDILAVAAARGWVKRMRYINDPDTYALKVA